MASSLTFPRSFPRVISFFLPLLLAMLVEGRRLSLKEEKALLRIKENTEMKNAVDSWRAGVDCDEWEGVTCDVTGHVVNLDLNLRDLLEENFPEVLTEFSSLETRYSDQVLSNFETEFERKIGTSVEEPMDTPQVVSNNGNGEKSYRENMKLWEERAKINEVVGYMTLPTIDHPARLVMYGENNDN